MLAFQLVLPEEEGTARKAATIEDILAWLCHARRGRLPGFSNAGALIGIVDRAGDSVPPGRSAEEMRAAAQPAAGAVDLRRLPGRDEHSRARRPGIQFG